MCIGKKDVRDFVAQCAVCQQSRYAALSHDGLLQPLPIPELMWVDVSMDFIEGLPKSGGLDTILVVVDQSSKYEHFIGLKHPFTAPSMADMFAWDIVRLHGIPHSIVSGQDRNFMSKFWADLSRHKERFSSIVLHITPKQMPNGASMWSRTVCSMRFDILPILICPYISRHNILILLQSCYLIKLHHFHLTYSQFAPPPLGGVYCTSYFI